jgi:Protein of unknown function (DUF3160)
MNSRAFNGFRGIILLAFLAGVPARSSDQVVLQFNPAGSEGVVTLHSTLGLPVSSMYSEYAIQRSTNLQNWATVTGPVSGGVGVSDERLRCAVPPGGDYAFYRVVANVKMASPDSRLGDSIYGYATEFGRQIQQVGQLPLDEFCRIYTPTNPYLQSISFDPTSATFWDQFNLDPAVNNATNTTHQRLTDFRLATNEFAIFQTNGFVVSGRLGTYSFADSFYKVFTDDLPVYFSCDAALHAWHRSYISMLEELEETCLAPALQTVIQGMGGQVSTLSLQSSGTALSSGVRDADYFLAVARSLITGTNDYGSLGQNAQILATLTAISNQQPATVITLFGTNRLVDCSQFIVRGHYQTSRRLQNYFRAMMWCGLIDFRFTGSTNDNSLRELSGAAAMQLLMKNSGQFANWQRIDSVVQMFVGLPDSMNFAQLGDLMTAANIQSPSSLPGTAALADLQSRIMAGQLGVQNIQSGNFFSPLSRQQIKLPRSFTVLGQRFVLDAWAMNECVFDRIIWDADGVPGFEDKVMRRVPGALDIAFSVLGNDQTVPEIASRIADPNGLPWRDGYPYQHNLSAVRRVIDAQDPAVWTNNVYHYWLACLRELSTPTTGAEYPDAMRTPAWAMKTLNTQLASWTELRHDNVLYVKQPYTGNVLCSFPDGFIEPRVGFWDRLRDMALRTKDLMATLPDAGQFVFEPNDAYDTPFTNSIGDIYTNRLQFLDNFATQMATLRDISAKELSRQPLTSNEVFFIQSLIENPFQYGSVRSYSGWYPHIFYYNARALRSLISPCDLWDGLVTDVQTDPTDWVVGDPGCILHEGVGTVHLLMIAVNWGTNDSAVYAGPVLSHYEFELDPATRETDSQWKSDIRAGIQPPQPDWTSSYLVPGTFTFPAGIH